MLWKNWPTASKILVFEKRTCKANASACVAVPNRLHFCTLSTLELTWLDFSRFHARVMPIACFRRTDKQRQGICNGFQSIYRMLIGQACTGMAWLCVACHTKPSQWFRSHNNGRLQPVSASYSKFCACFMQIYRLPNSSQLQQHFNRVVWNEKHCRARFMFSETDMQPQCIRVCICSQSASCLHIGQAWIGLACFCLAQYTKLYNFPFSEQRPTSAYFSKFLPISADFTPTSADVSRFRPTSRRLQPTSRKFRADFTDLGPKP